MAFGAEQKVAAPAVVPQNGPNILIIVTDDQRANSFGYMPQTKRWFLNGGRRYTRAIAVNPVCCPSRASIFTGLYSHNNNVFTNQDAGELDHSTTVQAALQDAGYQTYIAGKFLNDWQISQDPQYFDRWAVFADEAVGPNLYRNETWNVNGAVAEDPAYTTKRTGQYALDFLDHSEGEDDKPWLMYVFPFAPHNPYSAALKYKDTDVGSWDGNPAVFESRRDKPPWVRSEDADLSDGRKIRRGQFRTQMSVDDVVGDLMKALGENGERANTLAVFMSDNGILWGEHGLAVKRFPYKPNYNVPLMLRWPGEIEPGTVNRKIVANIDIAPTVLTAAGQPAPNVDGHSILQPIARDRLLLEGYASPAQPDDLPDWAATFTRDYQYTEYYDEAGEIVFREYYDMKNDPFQLRNLFRDRVPDNTPDRDELSATLTDDRDCEGLDCP
jgi:arylsulfatase A-like enzyme